MQETSKARYVPALGFHFLTPFYDAVVATTGRERSVKQALIKQADLEPEQQILDLGSGTGTLAIWIKQHQPHARVTGVDGDLKIISIASSKAQKANTQVQFDQALSDSLPYPEAQFDRVFSSMFFHHLLWEDKVRTAQEIFRVLKPGAELHVADWGRASNICMRGLFLTVQLLDGFKSTQDHVKGKLITLFEESGFVDVSQRKTFNTLYGTIALYSATKPS
ncbi:MAG: methyltransferase domain-containing protein [Desulfuromonadales bacterium]|jgi:ubiquinone/menaquinone biosynthesis C-methylase UbiE|nr:methyltransferase domain-containing protein [Desulfuromonadales bacterium]